jgi:cyanate lyase
MARLVPSVYVCMCRIYLALKAKASEEELRALEAVLQLSRECLSPDIGRSWYPNRGIGPIPPTDPVIYRLFEVGNNISMASLFSAYPFLRVCWYTAMP